MQCYSIVSSRVKLHLYKTEKLLWKAVIKFTNKLDFVRGNPNIPFYIYLNLGTLKRIY